MAKLVLTNPVITINAVDVSNHVAACGISIKVDEVDVTAFGSSGKERVGGLQDSQITLALHNDFASSQLETTVFPLIGQTTTVTIKPTNAAVSATNPLFSATVLCSEWDPIGSNTKVGDLVAPSVTWKVSGAVSKSTTSS